jgi:hypothetical protein
LISFVSEDFPRQALKPVTGFVECSLAADSVMHDIDQQTERIDHDMAFAAFDAFAAVVTAVPTYLAGLDRL